MSVCLYVCLQDSSKVMNELMRFFSQVGNRAKKQSSRFWCHSVHYEGNCNFFHDKSKCFERISLDFRNRLEIGQEAME